MKARLWAILALFAPLGVYAQSSQGISGGSITGLPISVCINATPTNGYVLTYTSSGQCWNAQAAGAGGAIGPAQGGTGSTTAPTAGQVLVGNAGGTAYAPLTLSGDISLTSSGVATVNPGTAANTTLNVGSATTTTINLGNATSNPAVNFLGSGVSTFNGNVQINAAQAQMHGAGSLALQLIPGTTASTNEVQYYNSGFTEQWAFGQGGTGSSYNFYIADKVAGCNVFTAIPNAGAETLDACGAALTIGTSTSTTTFLKGSIVLSGTSTGTTTLANANSGASNFTLTLPAATDTVADLAGTQAFTNKSYNGNTWTAGTGTLTLAAGKTLTASNSLTLAGTDATTMTFPTTSASIARTDAANTFTGTQTFGAITSTGIIGMTGGAISLNTSSNNAVNVGTGTNTQTVTLGGGSNAVTVNATTLTLGGTTLVTSTNPVTFSNAAIRFTGLASSSAATTGTLCWTTGAVNITVDTTVACLASTLKVKQDIEPLDAGLQTVLKLRPISYLLKPEFNPEHLGRMPGLIAEEVQQIDPRLVALDDNGDPRGVRYMQLTAVLAKAEQELNAKIERQQIEIYALVLWSLLLSGGLVYVGCRRQS